MSTASFRAKVRRHSHINRLQIERLEERLPLGDTLGLLLGSSLLFHEAPMASHTVVAAEFSEFDRSARKHTEHASQLAGDSLGSVRASSSRLAFQITPDSPTEGKSRHMQRAVDTPRHIFADAVKPNQELLDDSFDEGFDGVVSSRHLSKSAGTRHSLEGHGQGGGAAAAQLGGYTGPFAQSSSSHSPGLRRLNRLDRDDSAFTPSLTGISDGSANTRTGPAIAGPVPRKDGFSVAGDATVAKKPAPRKHGGVPHAPNSGGYILSATAAVVDDPCFFGRSPPVAGSQADLALRMSDQSFYWVSFDRILDRVDTGLTDLGGYIPASSWNFIPGVPGQPDRLVFTGGAAGAVFEGNVLFEPYNRAVVDVLRDGKRVRYLLTDFQADVELATTDSGGNNVGKVIVKNDDDDNNDAVSDLDQTAVTGETNLRALTITWSPATQPVFLRKGANGDKLRVWSAPNKTGEITFNGVDNKFVASPKIVYVEGISESTKLNDVEPFVNHNNSGQMCDLEKLTVLWVDTWTFGRLSTETFSADNVPVSVDFRTLQRPQPPDLGLGIHMWNDRVGQGIELRGRVKPSNFNQNIVIEREVQLCEFADTTNGSTLTRSRNFSTNNFLALVTPMGNGADSCATCNDQDPQSNGSAGHIYDWDNSGISNTFAAGTIIRTRKNFVQWPRFGSERAGVLAFWSQAISVKPNAAPPQTTLAQIPFETTFSAGATDRGDNRDLMTGLTTAAFKRNLNWDLNGAHSPSPLIVTTAAAPNGTVGTSYTATLRSTGGIPAVTWSVSAGALPGGLALDAGTGNISGTPTAAGTSNFTIRVTDNQAPTAGTATRAFTIVISNP